MLKQEIEHDEIFEGTWEAREIEWLPWVKNGVLSIVFCYARYTMRMEKSTNFCMKNSLTLHSLANKFFKSLADENDDYIYTFTDPSMRRFVRQSMKIGRFNALDQHYKSKISDEEFNFISKELDIFVDICEILEKFSVFLSKHEKLYGKEFDSKFKD